ncbi:MAG TPA: hypothetical protein VG323_07395 [Thermoanaerobaculia bacterium]|nr:hypothetical protein [Thermoanaerobaculia bacterium]
MRALIANRSLRVGEMPPDFLPRLRFRPHFEMKTAWLDDPATAVLTPVPLDDAAAAVVAALEPGRALRVPVAPRLLATLRDASILVPRGFANARLAAWRRGAAAARARFRRQGYAILPPLLPPAFVSAMAAHLRGLIAGGGVTLGDRQCPLRYAVYNDRLARFVHHQLTRAISEIAGQPLKPSYVYMASYVAGAELRRHRDREQCEVSVSFLVDFTPGAPAWPLKLDTRGGTVAVEQRPGDALLYRGCELPHYRDALPEGCTSTSLFLHYVPVAFAGDLR